jgi:hypothetical protein
MTDLNTLANQYEIPADAPGPITPETVVSRPEQTAPLPDRSILSTKLNRMLAEQEPAAQKQPPNEYERIRQENEILRKYLGQVPKEEKKAEEDHLSGLRREFEKERDARQQLETRLRQQEQQRLLLEAQDEVSTWVNSQKDTYPLVNALNQQSLVFQKMYNTRMQTGVAISESQATREIEQDLAKIVDQLAPLLGYQKGERRPTSEAEDGFSLTTPEINVSEPADRDKMSPEDWLRYLISKSQG